MNEVSYNSSQKRFLNYALMYMALGLMVSFITGYAISNSATMISLIYSSGTKVFALFAIELGLVVILSRKISSLSSVAAMSLFILYAVMNGVTFGSIFILYDLGSIISVFIVASLMFLCCSMIGITTKKDLSMMGQICIMGVIGLILASIMNIFIGASGLYNLISYVGVAIFCALTAYDMQKLKYIHDNYYAMDAATVNKFAIIGALELYLDFVNIFIYLIRIFGNRD